MANVGFFVIGGLGLFSLIAGIFSNHFPAPIPENGAMALRVIGFVLLGVAFTVRSSIRAQDRREPAGGKSDVEAGNSPASGGPGPPERRRD